MSNILFISSSPRGEASYSTRAARVLLDGLRASRPGAAVTVRDLGREPLPHISEDFVAGLGTPPEKRTESQRAALALSDELVNELLGADTVVIGSAMINFGTSSTLKTWIDYVARAGLTFRYTEAGKPEGLAKGKKVYIVEARGGVYADAPTRAIDFQEPYLKHMLGFMGMTDVEVVAIEGVAFGPEVAEKSFAAAKEKLGTFVTQAAA